MRTLRIRCIISTNAVRCRLLMCVLVVYVTRRVLWSTCRYMCVNNICLLCHAHPIPLCHWCQSHNRLESIMSNIVVGDGSSKVVVLCDSMLTFAYMYMY